MESNTLTGRALLLIFGLILALATLVALAVQHIGQLMQTGLASVLG